MLVYTLVFREAGSIVKTQDFQAHDDQEAREMVWRNYANRDTELWQGDRLVTAARAAPKPPSA
jgi:hypothetical protein